ncbi:MAG: 4Fe-4S dicluster domain-containing protein [Candidatus Thorarchaeota archaeon]
MGTMQWFTKNIVMRVGIPRVKRMLGKQRSLLEKTGIIHPATESPTRLEIPLMMLTLFQERDDLEMRHKFPIRRLLSIMKNIHRSVDSIEDNPHDSKSETTREFLEQLKEYSKSIGVGHVGFTKLPHKLIFQKYGVFFDNAIILTMEMGKEQIDKAPSQDTLNMVFGTYDDLGIATNKVTEFLREHGYAAQADHPLGGLGLYPPLAQNAGIGWVGKHGLLITPEFGSRLRLAAVYTSIENLPNAESNDHGWIEEYCMICGICVKQCPPQAILEEPIVHETGLITHITQVTCFEYFAQFYGCSVCVKVCPFSKAGDTYERLKAVVEKGS